MQVVQVHKCKLLAMVQRENGLGSYIAIDRGEGWTPPLRAKIWIYHNDTPLAKRKTVVGPPAGNLDLGEVGLGSMLCFLYFHYFLRQ